MKRISILITALALCACGQKVNLDYISVGIDVYDQEGELTALKAEYNDIKKVKGKTVAKAVAQYGECSFNIVDSWTMDEDVLTVDRSITVQGSIDGAGFNSVMSLGVPAKWDECRFYFPGVIYGKPHTTASSKGGSMYYDAHFFSLREDMLSAPVAVVAGEDNTWIAMLDPSPAGTTTDREANAAAGEYLIDEAFGFGAMNIAEAGEGIEMTYTFPGSCREFAGRGYSGPQTASPLTRRRCHPIKEGFVQNYRLCFKNGTADDIPQLEREVWRWAWSTLAPEVESVDIEQMRTTLLDHLAERVVQYEGRTGIPFVIDAKSGLPGSFRPASRAFGNRPVAEAAEIEAWAHEIGVEFDPSAAELDIWPWAVVGFCGKHVELAEQFLLESYRDGSERGRHFRELAEAVMTTLVRDFPVDGPVGEALDLRTGRVGNIHGGHTFCLRPIPEDMSRLMEIIKMEEARGISHPDWLAWGRRFADWLLTQSNGDGSFPSDWNGSEVTNHSGAETYSPIPMFIKLGDIAGESKYTEAALAGGEYLWNNYGTQGVYLGATGNAEVADKESGMLSAEAFMTLYEYTKDSKWLDRAAAAADYAESWIWIWNVPMPEGSDPAALGWKPGVPTIGVNGIGSNDVGGVDQYLDWAVPIYAKLYKYTRDEHYLQVARVLLHGTKAMLALPGRTYDLAGPGWQQEHWRMSQNRGVGAHRTWLPWVSINHLHGITGLESFDPELYKLLESGFLLVDE